MISRSKRLLYQNTPASLRLNDRSLAAFSAVETHCEAFALNLVPGLASKATSFHQLLRSSLRTAKDPRPTIDYYPGLSVLDAITCINAMSYRFYHQSNRPIPAVTISRSASRSCRVQFLVSYDTLSRCCERMCDSRLLLINVVHWNLSRLTLDDGCFS